MSNARKLWSFFNVFLIFTLLFKLMPAPAFAEQDTRENILIFWTERDCLKAVTLMCVQGPREPVGIVAIPVYIRLGEGGANQTIAEAYGSLGRPGITAQLEGLFKISIDGYLAMDQSTLNKASDIMGPVVMAGKVATMAEIFEGTYIDGEIEPQSEIRGLAASLSEPWVLVKAPQLVWILTSEVSTNLGCKNIWNIYQAVQEQGPDILRKKALTGQDYYVGGCKYRDVPPEVWVSVLKDVTRT